MGTEDMDADRIVDMKQELSLDDIAETGNMDV